MGPEHERQAALGDLPSHQPTEMRVIPGALGRRDSLARTLLRAARPRQWSKNVIVFLAPAAAGSYHHLGPFGHTAGTFVVFCAAASATYLLNDCVDAESDRHHPEKRLRPIAAGDLSVRVAIWTAAVLMSASLAASVFLGGWRLIALVATYLVVSLAYSLHFKKVPVVELTFLASGFVFRAIAGGFAAHIPLSDWFLVVVCFGALFVAVGKRAAELQLLGPKSEAHRQTLGMYTSTFLQSALVLTSSVTVTAYCLWAFGRAGIGATDHNDRLLLELTVVPVIIAVLYVLYLLDRGEGGAPEELVFRDRTLQSLGLMWAALFILGIYAA
jgi:decaprenyl-phosphate phosphoribosyltransferase